MSSDEMVKHYIQVIALKKALDLKQTHGLTNYAMWMFITKIEEDMQNYIRGLDRIVRGLAVPPEEKEGAKCSE